jgi:hypothetical protein
MCQVPPPAAAGAEGRPMLVNNGSTRNDVAPKENLAGSPAAVFTSNLCVAEAMPMPASSGAKL